MECLFPSVVMMKIADFDLGVCSRKVSGRDLEKAITKVLKTFEGVENLTAKQRDRIANFIRGNDVWTFYQRDSDSHCYFN